MKLPRILYLAFLSVLLPLPLLAQTGAMELTSPLPFDTAVRTGKLPNGLTYYIRHNSYPEHRAELRLVVHAGSILEDPDQQGLAHLTEHMCFNGTVEYPHNTLESFLEEHGARFGADLNASTSFDETIYKESLPTDQGPILDSGVDILAEWAHHVTFDSIEFEKERGVVREEWRLGRGAFERIYRKQAPIIFAGSRYAERNPIGLLPVIDTAHLATIKRFYHDWYRPDLMAVIIVGDFNVDSMVERVKSEFSPLTNPNPERPRTEYPIPMHEQTFVAVDTDREMPQTIFTMLFERPAKEVTTVADYRTEIVTALYEEMLNDRIHEAIQKGELRTAFAGAGDGAFLGHLKAFSIFALLQEDSVDSGVKGVLQQVFRAEQTGFDASELERAKASLLTKMGQQWNERDKTQSSAFVNEYNRNFTDQEPSPGIDYEYALYQKYVPTISLAEVNARSAQLMQNASPVMTFEGPASNKFTPPTKDQLLAILNTVKSEHYAAYVDKTSKAPLIATMPKPGKIVKETKLAPIGVTIWQLSNGARVIFKPTTFKEDEILFHAVAPGGSSTAPDAEYESAQSGDNIVTSSGVADFDASTLEKMLEGKDVEISPDITMYKQELEGHSSKKDLPTLFQLAYLYMTAPRYDSAAAETWLARTKATVQNLRKMPEITYFDSIGSILTQNNYRTRPESVELLNEIHPAVAYSYYKKFFGDANGFTFFLVGNIDPKTLRPLVEDYLASLPSSTHRSMWKDVGIRPPEGTISRNIYYGEAPKSMVTMIYTGFKQFSRENRFRLSAMAQAFQIKLQDDIRETKSGAYYVRVSPSFSKYPKNEYSLTINFGCDPNRVDELVAEVRRQIDTLVSKPIEATYCERIHKIMANELQVNLRENKYWMSELEDAFWNDLDPVSIDQASSLINSISPSTVFSAAKEYFNPKNCVQVVLYPAKKS